MKEIRLPIWLLVIVASALLAATFHNRPATKGMIRVEGTTHGEPATTINPFLLDKNLVTVAEFELFVKETGYITQAERYGDAGVFDPTLGRFISVAGAYYKFPFGKDNEPAKANHPVTQVSWHDALAFSKWKGKRLPTQAEWEHAASGNGLSSAIYSWGDNLIEHGKYKANTWQGSFPYHNTMEDGYLFTSPVGEFGANRLGLTDMGGNVWQWCADIVEPLPQDKIFDSSLRRILKGGSFLCDPTVCHGYEIFGVSSSTPESAMAHIGFRCAKDL